MNTPREHPGTLDGTPEPGSVLFLPRPDVSELGAGVYVLLSDPTAARVLLCLAGEDEDGDTCTTERTVTLPREALAAFEPTYTPPLPWPKPRVWATD